MRRTILTAGLGLLVAGCAAGQGGDRSANVFDSCLSRANKPEIRIESCTRVITEASIYGDAYFSSWSKKEVLSAAHHLRAVAYFETKQYDKSLSDADRAIVNDASRPGPFLLRGFLREGRNDLIGARADYEQVQRLDPGSEAARESLARLARRTTI